MYQDIDEPGDIEPALNRPSRLSVTWKALIALIVLSALLFLFLHLYQTQNSHQDPSNDTSQNAAISKVYRTAMSEPLAPLRRARLYDFVSTYPDSKYDRAAKAQLLVLNDEEARSWADVTNILYEPDSQRIERLIALDKYERKWGPSFLGGRDDDIKSIRENLESQTEQVPSRKLEDNPGIINQTPANKAQETSITDTELAGGPVIRIAPPPRLVETIRPTQTRRPDLVIAPKVRRNSAPRFPRRAERKGIEGLVILDLSIDESGRVKIAKLVSVEAREYQRDFVRAAQKAARRTRFFPKTVNGVAQPAANVRKLYRFALN